MKNWLKRLFAGRAADSQDRADSKAAEIPPDAYVIGRTADLLKVEQMIAPDDPRRSLFSYHQLREEEEAKWKRDDPRQAVASENPAAVDRLTTLVAALNGAYSSAEMEDLENVTPTAADAGVSALCHGYRNGTPVQRSLIRSQIDGERGWMLLTFSKRAAVFAVRNNDVDGIRESLIAHAIEDLAAGDVRDNLVALGLIYHCARIVHEEPFQWFREAMEPAAPAIAALFQDFICRPDLDGILSAMGWQEVRTPQGIGFRWDY
jgi:hypothetical protein